MAYFQAVGTIATDIIRKETSKGILASFRLKSGTPGRGQLWITVETWGHTAGVLNTHATLGRGIIVSGRLKQNVWSDPSTGQRKTRVLVVAHDLDFCDSRLDLSAVPVANQVTALGRVETAPRPDHTGGRLLFNIVSGNSGTKTGRLCLQVEAWGKNLPAARKLHSGDHATVGGRLGYRTRPTIQGEEIRGYELSAYTLGPIAATQRCPTDDDAGHSESIHRLHLTATPAFNGGSGHPKGHQS